MIHTLAVVVPFGPPDQDLLKLSSYTVYSCQPQDAVIVVDVKKILSVVAMLPHQIGGEQRYFLVEKPGLDLADLGGFLEAEEAEDVEETE
jgi:hypothetical protein